MIPGWGSARTGRRRRCLASGPGGRGAGFEGLFIHDSGVVLDANRAAAELFGRAVKELSRCRISELVAEESCRMLMQQINTRSNCPCPITGRRKDGTRVPLEITIKAVL